MSEVPAGVVHVWRAPLDDTGEARALRSLLSANERAQADRFHADVHRVRYAVAHGWLRRVLGRYVDSRPEMLTFDEGPNGKPALAGEAAGRVHFNLSHSADLALIAVSSGGPVGVDVEARDRAVEHLELAEHFFSPHERAALNGLAHDHASVVHGFFAAWTRKEAYLKATGHGITRGLHYFDVTLGPNEPARLLADRLDANATRRWAMASLDVGGAYSAAVVAEAPLRDVVLLDVSAM